MGLTGYIASGVATQVGQKFSQNLALPTGGFLGLEVSAACTVTVRGGRRDGGKLFKLALFTFDAANSDGVAIPKGIEYLEIEVSAALAAFTAEFLPG